MPGEHTRRTVLKTGAAVGSLAAVGALAGCNSLLGGSDSGEYADWLPAPAELSSDSNHYLFVSIDDTEIRANEDNIGDGYNESQQTARFPLSAMGVDYAAVDTRITAGALGGGTVVLGSFSESDVVDELTSNGFEEGSEYSGYTLLTREEGNEFSTTTELIALNGSTAVSTQSFGGGESDGPTARESAEALIDANNGEIDRYTEANDDMSTLVDELGSGVSVFGRTQDAAEETNATDGTFAGEVAGGQVANINGDTVEQTRVLVFTSSDDINTSDIETWTESGSEFEDVRNISVSQSGRVATVTAEGDTADAFGNDT